MLSENKIRPSKINYFNEILYSTVGKNVTPTTKVHHNFTTRPFHIFDLSSQQTSFQRKVRQQLARRCDLIISCIISALITPE